MRDKILFVLAISALIVTFTTLIDDGLFYPANLKNVIFSVGINCSVFSGVYLLLFNGTIKKATYWLLTILLVLITFLDTFCRTEDFKLGDRILILSLLAFPLGYTLRFIKKENKHLLDWLKMISITFIFVSKVLIELNLLNPDYILVGNTILVVACIVFWSNRNKVRDEFDFDFMKQNTLS